MNLSKLFLRYVPSRSSLLISDLPTTPLFSPQYSRYRMFNGNITVNYICVSARVCMCVCMHACMYVCMYICVCVCTCACVYIYRNARTAIVHVVNGRGDVDLRLEHGLGAATGARGGVLNDVAGVGRHCHGVNL